jgi:predicted DCC family thiol-disulfide oxidoreductase YuxK
VTAPRAWVLYDGACGFCRRWVPYWKHTLARRGIAIAPLQEPWVRERLSAQGVSAETQVDDIRLLVGETDTLLSGAEAYRWVLRRIWWATPLWVLSVTPGLRRVFDRTYRAVADNRHRISRACRLEPPPDA